ncbi:MAG: ACT domain-containing protein [bacterium]|nr:ACT domain-containing protein [bacterium]
MSHSIESALAAATLYSDDKEYVLVKLHARAVTAAAGVLAEIAEPFGALIVDKDEVSLIVERNGFEEFAKRLPDHTLSDKTYRLLTLDVELGLELVGFMARVSAALAAAGVNIFPYAAYSRDHLLVSSHQYETARQTLEQLKSSVSS